MNNWESIQNILLCGAGATVWPRDMLIALLIAQACGEVMAPPPVLLALHLRGAIEPRAAYGAPRSTGERERSDNA